MKHIYYLHIIIFQLICVSAPAANYYFSNSSGNDSRSFAQAQNPNTPWKSLDKLNIIMAQLQAGDSILFKRGDEFYGRLKITRSGTSSLPIVFGAYGDGPLPRISGLTRLSNWESVGNGIFASSPIPLPFRLNMVLVDDQNHPMGRYPNDSYLHFENHTSNSISDSELSSSPNWEQAELVLRLARFRMERLLITNHNNNQLTFNESLSLSPINGFGYFIQNSIHTLDKFGEWYFNPSTNRLYVYFGNQSPVNHKVEIATVNVIVEAGGSHINLQNLELYGSNLHGLSNDTRNLNNLHLDNVHIRYSGNDGIKLLYHTDALIENCRVVDSYGSGVLIEFRNPNTTIKNSFIRNSGNHPGMISHDNAANGIICNEPGLVAENNTILNSGFNGIAFTNNNNLIQNNYIHTFCTVLDDGAGIYTHTGDDNINYTNRRVLNNIIANGLGAPQGTTSNSSFGAAEGIYMDDNSSGVLISGNTISTCNIGMKIHNARNLTIEKNTIYDNNIQLSFENDNLGDPITNNTISNNIIFSKETDQVCLKISNADIGPLGSFSNNYYARPLDDQYTILVENGRRIEWFDLDKWQSVHQQDQGSQTSPLSFASHSLINFIGPNLFPAGTFDSNIRNLFCSGGGCTTNWEIKNELDGGSLKTHCPGPTNLVLGSYSINNSRDYILRFSIIASKEASLEISLRQAEAPYASLSPHKVVKIHPERTDYEVAFSSPVAEGSATLELATIQNDLTYWMDNFEFGEAEIALTNPERYIRFEFNPSQKDTIVSLDSVYMDVKETHFQRKITLSPFKSLVLIKDTASLVVLPVELVRFQSKLQDCNIEVEWTAQTEVNFSHYILEKSQDGRIFNDLAKIPGINSTGRHNYTYVDKNPKTTTYYRLKMVDKDSSFSYSDVIVRTIDCNGFNYNWEIYPTILYAENLEITTRFFSERDSVTLVVLDQFGRPLRTYQSSLHNGWNTFSWNLGGGLAPGVYYLHNPDAARNKTLRFLILN